MEWNKKIATLLYDRLEKRKNKENSILFHTTVRDDIRTLYPMQDITKRHKEFVIEKLSLSILILGIGILVSLLLIVKESGSREIENNRLKRNSYGEGSKSVELLAENGNEKAQIYFDLEEKEYTNKELEDQYPIFLEKLENVVLGENVSFDEVAYDLTLPDSISGYPFVMEWQTDAEYIDSNGKLIWNELTEPIVTELSVKITSGEFEKRETFHCCVQSRASPISMEEKLQEMLLGLEEENKQDEYLLLPTEYGGNDIVWEQKREKKGLLFLAATPLVCLLLYFSKDRDLHKKVEEREEQMKMDYPEVVSKLALLLGAGMTVQNAWNKVAFDYTIKKKSEGYHRYAYEEMLLTVNELKNGIYQNKALEEFGRRCKIPCYNRLATLLTQNLRSGSTNLAMLLQEEAKEAFEERKHMARRQGEKAGTKLLLPMMLLLMIVMAIIIVPTFISNMR